MRACHFAYLVTASCANSQPRVRMAQGRHAIGPICREKCHANQDGMAIALCRSDGTSDPTTPAPDRFL